MKSAMTADEIVFRARGVKHVSASDDGRKSWTTEDLSQLLAVTEHTLSELLVLLYQVIQTNQTLVERVYGEQVGSSTGQ